MKIISIFKTLLAILRRPHLIHWLPELSSSSWYRPWRLSPPSSTTWWWSRCWCWWSLTPAGILQLWVLHTLTSTSIFFPINMENLKVNTHFNKQIWILNWITPDVMYVKYLGFVFRLVSPDTQRRYAVIKTKDKEKCFALPAPSMMTNTWQLSWANIQDLGYSPLSLLKLLTLIFSCKTDSRNHINNSN